MSFYVKRCDYWNNNKMYNLERIKSNNYNNFNSDNYLIKWYDKFVFNTYILLLEEWDNGIFKC